MKIGIISDTHNFLEPKIPKLFAGVDHILHAGDIGSPRIIMELEAIAPVTAVLGNTDDAGLRFKQSEFLELGGWKFLIHHIVNPHELSETLRAHIERDRPDVVVFGHTHKRFCETIEGTLFMNPGYAGHSRFGMERSAAILTCDNKGLRQEYLKL